MPRTEPDLVAITVEYKITQSSYMAKVMSETQRASMAESSKS